MSHFQNIQSLNLRASPLSKANSPKLGMVEQSYFTEEGLRNHHPILSFCARMSDDLNNVTFYMDELGLLKNTRSVKLPAVSAQMAPAIASAHEHFLLRRFTLRACEFPGCCGAVIFHGFNPVNTHLLEAFYPCIEKWIMKDCGYSVGLATLTHPQSKIMEILSKFGWDTTSQFINKRTTNTVYNFGKTF